MAWMSRMVFWAAVLTARALGPERLLVAQAAKKEARGCGGGRERVTHGVLPV